MSKVILVIALITGIIILGGVFLNRKKPIRIILFAVSLYLIAAAMSYFVIDKIDFASCSIVKIELSNFSRNAQNVFLSEIIVDGKNTKITKVKDGDWVRKEGSLGWINPKKTTLINVTDFINIKIPKGYTRQLNFTVKGKNIDCKITENDKEAKTTFINGTNHVLLESSPKAEIYFSKLKIVGIYTLLFFSMVFGIQILIWNGVGVLNFFNRNRFYIALFTIVFLSFICMCTSSGKESFWYDETYTIGWLQENDPLNSMFLVFELLTVWLNIVPYGQEFLLLLTEFFLLGTIIFAGLSGKLLRNEQTGIFSAVFIGFSSYAIHNAAYEFRSYAFLLFYTSITFYFFLVKNKKNTEDKWYYHVLILYSIFLMLLVDSHEYGKIVGLLYIFIDILLMLGRRIKKRSAFTWVLPIGYLIYWFFRNTLGGLWNNYGWPQNPDFEIVCNTLFSLCGRRYELFILFVMGFFIIVKKGMDYLLYRVTSKKQEWQIIGYVTLFMVLVGVFTASIVYSNVINPQNSLYVNRYFIAVLFNILMMAAIALDAFVSKIIQSQKLYDRVFSTYICAAIMVVVCWFWFLKAPLPHNEDFRGTAQWMKRQDDVYDKNVLIFLPESPYHELGWLYYFCEGQENHKPNISGSSTLDMSNTSYDKIYVITLKYSPTPKQKEWLDTNYSLQRKIKKKGIEIYKKR